MCELTAGRRFRLPNGVPVEALPSTLRGVQWELSARGWCRWIVQPQGEIARLDGFDRGKRLRTQPTGWTLDDLAEAEGIAT